MTRINVVPPFTLTDSHLLAEYRELPRIFTSVKKLKDLGKALPENSCEYVLGKGHCKFFYNKIGWLISRYIGLHDELIRRGFDLNEQLYKSVLSGANEIDDGNDEYAPTPEEMYKNMYRLSVRHFKIEDQLFH